MFNVINIRYYSNLSYDDKGKNLKTSSLLLLGGYLESTELEVVFKPLGFCPNPTSNGCWTPYKLISYNLLIYNRKDFLKDKLLTVAKNVTFTRFGRVVQGLNV